MRIRGQMLSQGSDGHHSYVIIAPSPTLPHLHLVPVPAISLSHGHGCIPTNHEKRR